MRPVADANMRAVNSAFRCVLVDEEVAHTGSRILPAYDDPRAGVLAGTAPP